MCAEEKGREEERERERERKRAGERDRERDEQTGRDRPRQTETDRDRQRQTETDRDRPRQRDRERERERELFSIAVGPSGSRRPYMPSNGHECEGVLGNGHHCRLSRDGAGNPILLNSRCKKCKEWRCRTHCRCGRENKLRGRERPRSKDPERPTGPAVEPRAAAKRAAVVQAAVPPVPAPVGRPASLQVEVLPGATWWPRLLEDVAAASRVVVAVYLYDNTSLHELFLQKLRGRRAFDLQVTVDKEGFEKRDAPRQRPKLLALKGAGAKVCVASGEGTTGRLHCKAVVLDRRVAYTGSANLTEKSESNHELVCRLQGPPVQAVSEAVATFCAAAVFI